MSTMSKKIDWVDLVSRITHLIQLKKAKYEVCWIDDFKDGKTLGETRFNHPKQILIKNGQSSKEAVSTYFHEVLHAVSEEFEVGLTEEQVLKLEKAIPWVLKPGNLLKDKK